MDEPAEMLLGGVNSKEMNFGSDVHLDALFRAIVFGLPTVTNGYAFYTTSKRLIVVSGRKNVAVLSRKSFRGAGVFILFTLADLLLESLAEALGVFALVIFGVSRLLLVSREAMKSADEANENRQIDAIDELELRKDFELQREEISSIEMKSGRLAYQLIIRRKKGPRKKFALPRKNEVEWNELVALFQRFAPEVLNVT